MQRCRVPKLEYIYRIQSRERGRGLAKNKINTSKILILFLWGVVLSPLPHMSFFYLSIHLFLYLVRAKVFIVFSEHKIFKIESTDNYNPIITYFITINREVKTGARNTEPNTYFSRGGGCTNILSGVVGREWRGEIGL